MKIRRVFLVAIGLFLLVALADSIVHHFRLRRATDAYVAELRVKGEPLDLAQVLPPAVPPERNGAEALRQADEMFRTNNTLLSSNYYFSAMKMVAPGKAAVVSEQPDYRDWEQTNSWESLREAVAQNAGAFALLRQIVQEPSFGVEVHYEKGIGNLAYTNLLLTEAKVDALRLGSAALSDLRQKNSASAVENLRAMLAIGEGMRPEHLIISELVRDSIVPMAITYTWETLESTNVADEQLAALQKDWSGLEFFHAMQTAFELERASDMITADQWRVGNPGFEKSLLEPPAAEWLNTRKPNFFERLRIRTRVFRWRYWWSYPDELRFLEGYESILDALRAAQTNDHLWSIQSELQKNIAKFEMPTNAEDYFWFSDPMKVDLHYVWSSSIDSSARAFYRAIKIEMDKRLAVTAIALKRYQLKNREYPAALDALAPEFLPTIPLDLDGKPLRYRQNADGSFVLYSIGEDGKDDGGDPKPPEEHKSSLAWDRGRDWVWPQPATPQEVQNYYDHPPK